MQVIIQIFHNLFKYFAYISKLKIKSYVNISLYALGDNLYTCLFKYVEYNVNFPKNVVHV